MKESTYLDLVEKDNRQYALRLAKAWALNDVCGSIWNGRSIVVTNEQARRFRASDDPFKDFPDETLMFVAFHYDRIRRRQTGMWYCYYSDEIGRYRRWDANFLLSIRRVFKPHPFGWRRRKFPNGFWKYIKELFS